MKMRLCSSALHELCTVFAYVHPTPSLLCSLGGMCVLMYCVNCEMEGRPHRFSRLVLLR